LALKGLSNGRTNFLFEPLQSSLLLSRRLKIVLAGIVLTLDSRPFVDVGPVYRHVSSITTRTYGPNIIGALGNNNAPELQNRNSFGGVAGFGLGFKVGSVELTPEVRYTRWANSTFVGNGLKSNLDQGDVLLGITF
jgi:hypothetical protein